MDYVVTTNNLTKKFGDFTAVNNLNMQIKKGEIYGFLGPNGAGKSTAIRMLCGILEPTSGSATILGYDLTHQTEKIKQNIGYMSQKFSLYDDLTVEENLIFYAGLYNITRQKRKLRVGEMVELAGLTGREHELTANLSGGWRQKLALGCAIISRPQILFLDEPTSGVSPTSRRLFFNIIRNLVSQGTTVMVTTHFMDEAEYCDNIAFISQGSLMAVDCPDNLKKNAIEGYLVEIDRPNAMDIVNEIENLPYVTECSIHGSLLHVLLINETEVESLKQIVGVKPKAITPSLEDVFIALAKKKAGQGGEQA